MPAGAKSAPRLSSPVFANGVHVTSHPMRNANCLAFLHAWFEYLAPNPGMQTFNSRSEGG